MLKVMEHELLQKYDEIKVLKGDNKQLKEKLEL
jgi:hypothetical protein